MYLVITTNLAPFSGSSVKNFDTLDKAKSEVIRLAEHGCKDARLAQEIPYKIKPAEVEF